MNYIIREKPVKLFLNITKGCLYEIYKELDIAYSHAASLTCMFISNKLIEVDISRSDGRSHNYKYTKTGLELEKALLKIQELYTKK